MLNENELIERIKCSDYDTNSKANHEREVRVNDMPFTLTRPIKNDILLQDLVVKNHSAKKVKKEKQHNRAFSWIPRTLFNKDFNMKQSRSVKFQELDPWVSSTSLPNINSASARYHKPFDNKAKVPKLKKLEVEESIRSSLIEQDDFESRVYQSQRTPHLDSYIPIYDLMRFSSKKK